MAQATFGTTSNATVALRDGLSARLASAAEGWGRWRLYRRTLTELSNLSNRELADLGLSRSMLRSVAMEAAYKR